MTIENIIAEGRNIAENEAKERGFRITNTALDDIKDTLVRNTEIIEESITKKAKSDSDIYKSIKVLIGEASYLAKAEKETVIYSSHIKKTMDKICPTYWPLC